MLPFSLKHFKQIKHFFPIVPISGLKTQKAQKNRNTMFFVSFGLIEICLVDFCLTAGWGFFRNGYNRKKVLNLLKVLKERYNDIA
jgi:hypothetical protein